MSINIHKKEFDVVEGAVAADGIGMIIICKAAVVNVRLQCPPSAPA